MRWRVAGDLLQCNDHPVSQRQHPVETKVVVVGRRGSLRGVREAMKPLGPMAARRQMTAMMTTTMDIGKYLASYLTTCVIMYW
jgi:hypothetical protein